MLLYVHRNPRLIRDGSPGWPPGFSLSSWALGTLGFRSRSLLFVVVVFCSPHGGEENGGKCPLSGALLL